MTDVWRQINSRPNRIKRPFGSALDPTTNGRIVSPMMIEEPTRLPNLRRGMKEEKESE